ncbi:hypothetical protein SCUP515_09816 [Seiridium cupressi]
MAVVSNSQSELDQQQIPNILKLPTEIRHHIYEAAGLVSGAVLRLVPGRGMGHGYAEEPPSESCLLTLNVLQACKAMHAEVKNFICARNTLVVVFEHVDYGLEYLHRFRPQQCAVLKDLVVQLHLEAAVDGSENEARDPPRAPPEKQLNQDRISLWTTAARHILSNTTPHTLNLRLFCDTGASDTTLAVLQPLKDFPGVLNDCALRLHHQKNDRVIRTIACEVANRARGFDPGLRARPFHFFNLPPEIRTHILEYSDLVTPYTEIYWSANRGFRIALARSRCGGDEGRKRLDIARFITRHMWPDVLHNLRNIELVFPAIHHNKGMISCDPNYADLCFAIDHLKAHANLGQLTIIVHMTTANSVLQGDQQSIHRAFVESGGAWRVAVQPHRQLLSHFENLRGTNRFFVHLEWAWRWCVEHPYVGRRHSWLDVETHGFESQLEKFVMGNDYQSETAGKVKEQPSIWLHSIWGRGTDYRAS